jgi:hypothetical protein
MSKRKGITISILKTLLRDARLFAKNNSRSLSNQIEMWIREKLESK